MERASYLNEKYNNVNSNIVEAMNLFDTVIETNKKIREKCEEYLRTMLEIKGGEIAMTGDQGEVVSVTYDGGTHPEYASNAYSIVNCVYLKDKDIYLSTEDSDEYPLENIDTDEVYTLATFIYEVLEHNERPSEDSAEEQPIESEEFDEEDFYDAVCGYGELEHDELMEITGGQPIIINGKEVDTILDDDGLKFSYISEDGRAYCRNLNIDDIDEEICQKIYDFLYDNQNTNIF